MAKVDRTYTPFAFGPLNVAVPEHTVPDGTLRAVKNIIPLGPGDAPFWGAANPELQVGDLTGVLGITAHQRGRLGELSDLSGDPNQSHERLVEMTSSNIYLVDPGQSFAKKSIFAFSANDPARKMQAAQLGEYLYLAISGTPPMVGVPFSDRGFPEPVREIRDDEVLPLHLPDLPAIQMSSGITAPTGVTIERKLRRGRYPVRFAFRLKDGSYGPPSEPRILDIGIAVTTLNGAVAIGDSTFTVNSISSLFGAIYEAYKAGEDTTTAFVENERVTMASLDVGTSTVTLATGTYFTQAHADASDVDTGRGYWVKFDLTASVASPWEEIISGISVLMGQNVLNDEDGLRAPFYHVVEIEGITFNDEVYWSENDELISANPLHDESILTMHEIGAAATFVYNARLHLGDLSFNFKKPAFLYTNGQGGTPVRFGVRLETENGSFLRISDPVYLDSTTVSFENNILAYPDIRATEFIIYYDGGSGFKVSHSYKPKKSNVINVSYLILDGSITVAATGADMPNATTTNQVVDRNPNRYIVSDVLQPRSLGADLVYEVGESANDPIIGFAANTHAVSEGQYGDYPLIILSSETVSLAQVGSGAVPYVGIQRIANRGCVGRYAFTNYERLVFFAARDGVWALGPHISDDAISASIHYHYGSGDLFTCLTNDTCMGYYNDNLRGRREIWMGAGKLTFGYSPVHSTWFILDRERKDFHLLNGVLYGVSGSDDSRKTYDEGGSEEAIAVYLRTNRMTLGMPGVRKRIYRTSIRQTLQAYELHYRYRDVQTDGNRAEIITGQINAGSLDTVSHSQGLAYMPELELYGFMLPGQGLVSFAIEWAPMRRNTAHASVPTPADITPTMADVSDIAWDCSEGFNDDPNEIPDPPALGGIFFVGNDDDHLWRLTGDFADEVDTGLDLTSADVIDMAIDQVSGLIYYLGSAGTVFSSNQSGGNFGLLFDSGFTDLEEISIDNLNRRIVLSSHVASLFNSRTYFYDLQGNSLFDWENRFSSAILNAVFHVVGAKGYAYEHCPCGGSSSQLYRMRLSDGFTEQLQTINGNQNKGWCFDEVGDKVYHVEGSALCQFDPNTVNNPSQAAIIYGAAPSNNSNKLDVYTFGGTTYIIGCTAGKLWAFGLGGVGFTADVSANNAKAVATARPYATV